MAESKAEPRTTNHLLYNHVGEYSSSQTVKTTLDVLCHIFGDMWCWGELWVLLVFHMQYRCVRYASAESWTLVAVQTVCHPVRLQDKKADRGLLSRTSGNSCCERSWLCNTAAVIVLVCRGQVRPNVFDGTSAFLWRHRWSQAVGGTRGMGNSVIKWSNVNKLYDFYYMQCFVSSISFHSQVKQYSGMNVLTVHLTDDELVMLVSVYLESGGWKPLHSWVLL